MSSFHPVLEGEYTPGAAAKSKGSPLRQAALYHFLIDTRSHDCRQSPGHVTMCPWQVSHYPHIKFFQSLVGQSEEKAIAVIQSGCEEGMNECFCDRVR